MDRARFYRSPAFPAGSGPDFVNTAVAIRVSVPPWELLAELHKIEEAFGRERRTRWGARTLDLDLVGYGDLLLPDAETQAHWRNLPLDVQAVQAPDELILPHPRIQDRAFVLLPLMDIAPDWIHPGLGLTVAQLCARLPAASIAEVVRFQPDFPLETMP